MLCLCKWRSHVVRLAMANLLDADTEEAVMHAKLNIKLICRVLDRLLPHFEYAPYWHIE